MAALAEDNKNYRQLLIKILFSNSGMLIKIQKLFIILTILKEIFFRDQNLKGLAENKVQNLSTCRGLISQVFLAHCYTI